MSPTLVTMLHSSWPFVVRPLAVEDRSQTENGIKKELINKNKVRHLSESGIPNLI